MLIAVFLTIKIFLFFILINFVHFDNISLGRVQLECVPSTEDKRNGSEGKNG